MACQVQSCRRGQGWVCLRKAPQASSSVSYIQTRGRLDGLERRGRGRERERTIQLFPCSFASLVVKKKTWNGRGSAKLQVAKAGRDVAAETSTTQLVVIGGGAAGYFSAISAALMCPKDLSVTIIEQSKTPLEKVRISGGGRCNVTNVVSEASVLAGHYPRGHRELKGAFFRVFGSEDVREWFTSRGVALKVEKDGRIFPVSNSSESIIKCLQSEAERLGIKLMTQTNAKSISVEYNEGKEGKEKFETHLKSKSGMITTLRSSFLVLATGSSVSGWNMARNLGHSVIKPYPSLFSFRVSDKHLTALAGISLHAHAMLKIKTETNAQVAGGGGGGGGGGEKKFVDSGPLLITHWGLSGPLVLKLSAWAARELAESKYKASMLLDLASDKTEKDLEEELFLMKRNTLKKVGSATPPSVPVPKRLWNYMITRVGIPPDKLYSECKDATLRKLAACLKRLEIQVNGKGPFKEEFVTAGGVDLKEVNMKVMESKKVKNLYFAGEILNVDGVTGGFNFQNAWTGGYLAGSDIANSL